MINDLEIKNFKSFKHLKVSNFGRLNVLIGPNAAGKTSLLHAIFAYSLHGKVDGLLHISNSAKEAEHLNLPADTNWLFHKSNVDNSIQLSGHYDGTPRDVEISVTYGDGNTQANMDDLDDIESGSTQAAPRNILGLKLTAQHGQRQAIGELSFIEKDFKVSTLDSPYIARLNQVRRPIRGYIDLPKLWSDVEKITDDSYSKPERVTELMRQFDPDIVGFRIAIADDGTPSLRVIHKRLGTAPIGIFGDGIAHAFEIACQLSRTDTDVLMIDEPDAALHVETLSGLARFMRSGLNIASGNICNVSQIFLTTHRLDTIDALINAFGDCLPLLAFHKITCDTSTGAASVVSFNGEEAESLRENIDLDFRASEL